MTSEELNKIRIAVKEKKPLIHCITNPISVNQCANTVLAAGARPIMAEHPREAAEITATAQALLINLGNITDARIKSAKISLKTASKSNIPVVLDAVGISCSALRRKSAYKLIKTACPSVIKGNYSEIRALENPGYKSAGVDAESTLTAETAAKSAVRLARKYKTVILASGKTDIITDGERAFYIKNGSPQLAAVTGTGCMLGALCCCFLAVRRHISAAVTACALLGICGKLAETDKGTGSFSVNLMDKLSALPDEAFISNLRLEEIKIEDI